MREVKTAIESRKIISVPPTPAPVTAIFSGIWATLSLVIEILEGLTHTALLICSPMMDGMEQSDRINVKPNMLQSHCKVQQIGSDAQSTHNRHSYRLSYL